MSKIKRKHDKVIKFHEDGSVTVEKVNSVLAQTIETETGILNLDDAKKAYDSENGGVVYLFNVDIPAKVEAEKLKDLRRSVALSRMFEYSGGNKPSMISFMPWIAFFAVLLFK